MMSTKTRQVRCRSGYWLCSCQARRNEYDVDEDGGEDAGGRDYREKEAARTSLNLVRLLAQLSEGQKQREVLQYDTVSTMSMRIPAAWMMSSMARQVR